jgi:hypothetical protein
VNDILAVRDRLNESSARQFELGDGARAQELLLLAKVLRAGSDRIAVAFGTALDTPYVDLRASDSSLWRRTAALAAKLSGAEAEPALGELRDNVQRAIDDTAAIIDSLPAGYQTPMYYGPEGPDVLLRVGLSSTAVRLLGYRLFDEKAGKPTVLLDDLPVPEERMELRRDAIAIRKAVEDEERPECERQPAIRISLTIRYRRLVPGTARPTAIGALSVSDNTVPGVELFDIRIHFEGFRESRVLPTFPFEVTGGQVNVDCGAEASTTVQWTLPVGATLVSADATWIDTIQVKGARAATVVEGDRIRAIGTIVGLDHDTLTLAFGALRNCRGGGHGTLRLSGIAKQQRSGREDAAVDVALPRVSLRAPGSVLLPVESGLALQSATVEVRRAGCATVLDELILAVDAGGTYYRSKSGRHRAHVEGGRLWIEASRFALSR